MISAVYTQGQGFAIAEMPVPDIGEGEVLVRVHAAAICGTDIKIARSGHAKPAQGQRIILGHEFVGTIEIAGAKVKGLVPGMRVGVAPNWGCGSCPACKRAMANLCREFSAFGINNNGAHASHVRIPVEAIAQGNVLELPLNVPWDEAALTEPLSCVLNGQKVVQLAAGENILIYGAGPMGLLHVLLARATGAEKIIVVDQNTKRLSKAREIGADVAINNSNESVVEGLKQLRLWQHIDVAIIATPVRDLAQEAIGILAQFGRLCLFAGLRGDTSVLLDSNTIHYRNLCVTGTTGGAIADYRVALGLIASRKVDVRRLISHRFSLSQLRDAYDVALAGEGLKVVLTAESNK